MFSSSCVVVLLILAGSCLSLNSQFLCGRKSVLQELAVGNEPVVKNQWPWLVPLIHIPTNQHFCSGSIVSENHVITAAQCIHDKKSLTIRQTNEIVALLGKNDLSAIYEKGSSTFYPTEVFVHPNWNPNSQKFDSDLAILFSENAMQFSLRIAPICLPSDSSIDSLENGVVSRWGSARSSKVPSPGQFSRHVQVESIAMENCIEDDPALDEVSTLQMFCAQGIEDNSVPCVSDTGKNKFHHPN